MANYKRGKCRRNCPKAIRGSSASWRARHGFKPARINLDDYDLGGQEWKTLWKPRHLCQMSSYPAWWDREFHTRPKRAETRRLERGILSGADPDNVAWPVSARKPHVYYW
jgi:hypothetical protein